MSATAPVLHPSHNWESTPDETLLERARSYGKAWTSANLHWLQQCQACMIQSFEPGAESECACAGDFVRRVQAARQEEGAPPPEAVNHPAHYGGADNPYEAIKVIEAWSLNFCLGNAVKYISRLGKKAGTSELEDLKKARWYLDREIKRIEEESRG